MRVLPHHHCPVHLEPSSRISQTVVHRSAGQLLRRHRRIRIGGQRFHSRRLQQRHRRRINHLSIRQRQLERTNQPQHLPVAYVADFQRSRLPVTERPSRLNHTIADPPLARVLSGGACRGGDHITGARRTLLAPAMRRQPKGSQGDRKREGNGWAKAAFRESHLSSGTGCEEWIFTCETTREMAPVGLGVSGFSPASSEQNNPSS